ncbi:hypothetical protein [Ruegeria sp. YS9]|uniref:hypothetical protein n=1 Tax=Ruegeria sp. YS9 TaxID=2966453 RepID=UPI00214BB7C1|nr:hypothetical protein [Ruegeria sp. YS9]UUV05017.1 hypothetical protein NOR97_10275 [Ruegeria sp. YS9]
MKHKFSKIVAAIGCLASLSTGAMACESAPQNEGFKIKKVLPDCSFRNGGRGQFAIFGGKPVVDIGNGRVGQRIHSGEGCSPDESLFFMNCADGTGIVVEGLHYSSEIAGYAPSSIDLIQKPLGAIGLTSETTVSNVEEVATKNRYTFTKEVRDFFGRSENHKRIDYTCGCKLYYPDSPGAKL